ncbi:unnamed protein product [Callosobruchus maculatus]|uniref:Uncharacterized protein n=1 Tax=Callosobruchus maculatus TaxID=64391 RepID=A0A653CHU8_CALMS|nr:unnamed protein product [Callosobruchus maculatus]
MMKFCSLFLVALILVAISEVQGQGHQIKAAPKDSPNLIVLDGDRKQGGKPNQGTAMIIQIVRDGSRVAA